MQTTLLGLGIAIILALVAALVGPHFIDWSVYRSSFEKEATRIVGMPVKIGGTIDARLLPVPSLTLHQLEGRRPNGKAEFAAQEIAVEFALGPLLRGQWRISEMHIVGPRIGVGLAADGRVDWVGTEAGIDPNSLAIEHLTIDDGHVTLSDAASGSQFTLDTFTFGGALPSLAGPIKGDGTFATRAGAHGYHLNAGRRGDDGTMRVHLTVDPGDPPLAADIDGTLSFDKASPRFAGTLKLERPPRVSLVKGRAVANEPWTLSGKLAATSAHAVIDELQLQYGPDDRAVKLGGKAELKLGAHPQLDATVSARHLDLDRFVALPPATRGLPLVAIRSAADALGDVLRPGLPVHIGISLDTLALADATLREVHGKLSADEHGWSIDELDLQAPGATRLHASGRLAMSPPGHAFSGPATIQSADPKALAAWLKGAPAWSGAPVGALRASGDVTLAPDRIVVDRLSAELDHKSLTGRLDYEWAWQGKGPRLEAALNAADLDLDAAAALLRNALPGMHLALPAECVLALDIGHATVAGVEANRTKAKLKLDSTGLAIDELTVGDFAGTALALSGRVQGPWSAPTGTLALTLDGKRLDGLVALLAKIAPEAGSRLTALAPQLAPANLKVTIALDHAADTPASTATLRLDGTIGMMRIAWTGNAHGDPAAWKSAALRSALQIDAADGRTLGALFGLDQTLAIGPGAGALLLNANSTAKGALAINGRLAVPGTVLTTDGTARLGDDGQPTGRADISATIADGSALRALNGDFDQPAPLALNAKMAFENHRFVLDNLAGRLPGSTLSGQIALTPGRPLRIEGRINADRLPAGALLAAIAGVGKTPPGKPALLWPTEPFGPGLLADASGRIALTATHASLGPKLDIQNLQTTLRLNASEVALDDIHGTLAGGRLSGSVTLQRSPDGVATSVQAGLDGADLGVLLPASPHPPMTGRVSLHVEAKGSGRSPAVLAETLGGFGNISIQNVEFAGLDPAAFDAATRATDQSVDIDAGKIKALVEVQLGKARLHLRRLDGAFTLSGGQLRLGGVVAHADKADIGLNANVDITQSNLDARLTLLGAGTIAQAWGRPEISVMLKGPLLAPARTVDVSTLVGWLTLRAVDQQTKRLEAAEAEHRKADEAARRLEETTRQAAEAAEKKRAAIAEQQRRAAEAARTLPSIALPPAADSGPPATPLPTLPPAIEIRPAPGQHRTNEAHQHPTPRIVRPEHNSAVPPPAIIQRDPRLPPQ